jgi:hypothetical protein
MFVDASHILTPFSTTFSTHPPKALEKPQCPFHVILGPELAKLT